MTTAQELKTMKKELQEMKNLLADQLEETASNGHSKTMLTRAEIQALAHKAGESVRGFVSDKRDQAQLAKRRTEKTIKSHPFASTAIAVAGGLVLGALLRGSKNNG